MHLRGIYRRVRTSNLRQEFPIALLTLAFVLCAGPLQSAQAQEPNSCATIPEASLRAEQVIQNLTDMNRQRAQALRSYQGTRIYRVQYHGFPGTRNAEMIVSARYVSPATKEFTVESSTGAKVIIDKVFKKLLEAEKEAMDPDVQRRSALSTDNYLFALIGCETGPTGPMYVLSVAPRTKDKFLYRGRIWVDAEDFAVVRLQAEPAKNPSFWTTKTEIVQEYSKLSDFWLPAHNRSVTTIRLGGHAELSIDYKDYVTTGTAGTQPVETTIGSTSQRIHARD